MAYGRCKHCKHNFASVGLHREHRVTTAGPVSPERCLTTQEMERRGWRLSRGRWEGRNRSVGPGSLSWQKKGNLRQLKLLGFYVY